MPRLGKIEANIVTLPVDAVVNAANRSLLGGGGVDGAIHRAAGPELLEECRGLNGCETGRSKITKGYRLPAKYVIHTVGPVWHGGNQHESELLADCYTSALDLANQYQLKTVAFPAISTGVYRFPKKEAAKIAVKAVMSFLSKNIFPEQVIFVCFGKEDFLLYEAEGIETCSI